MSTVAKPIPITAEDFERIAPLLGPCELVEGEIVRMCPGGVRHSAVTVNVVYLFERYNREFKLGRVLSNEAGMVVKQGPDTVRGADVLFISCKRLPGSEDWEGFLRHPPELIVEVLSADSSWKKMEEKVAEYLAFGVDLVWVADPQTLSVRVFPRGAAPFVLHTGDDIDAGEAFPGFRCRVAEFFSR